MTSVTDAEGATTTFTRDAYGNVASTTEPGKAAETYTRNSLGDLLSVSTPEGRTTSFEYNANGALTKTTDPANRIWRIERDTMDRPTAYVDPAGERTEIAYDGNGNRIRVTDRRGKITRFTYDNADRLVELEQPSGADWDYDHDPRGNVISAVNPRGNETTYAYDNRDLMTRASEPLGRITDYEYNALGAIRKVTDPLDHETVFTYDDVGRLSQVDQPLGKSTSYGYDDASNLTSRTTPEDTLTYVYDDADRLTSIQEGLNVLRSFGYDDASRVIAATDEQGATIAIGYDDDDLPVSVDDGRGQTATLTYNNRGLLSSEDDGRGTISYGYDDLGRLTSLTDPSSSVLTFAYDDEGDLTESELPNGVVTTNGYDADGLLKRTTSVKGSNILQDFTYDRSPNGDVVSETDRHADVTSYGYDALDRLVSFDTPGGPAVAYDYDDAGNRTEAGGTTFSYDALNRLTSSSDGRSYSYDGAGRLTAIDGPNSDTTFAYDALDQVREVDRTGQNPASVNYDYDALARRTTRGGQTTSAAHYAGLGDSPTIDTGGGGQVTASYVYGADGLAEERTAGGTVSYPLADGHGDITALTDAQGAISSRQVFDPWGIQLSGPERDFGYLGAFGRRTDPSFDTLQMGIRSYLPELGAFASEDPVVAQIGNGAAASRYQYAFQNPRNVYDLSGAFPDTGDPTASDNAGYADDLARSAQQKEACTGDEEPGDFLNFFGHEVVGYIDSGSFGLTRELREGLGTDGAIDYCNAGYGLGSGPVSLVGPGGVLRFGAKGVKNAIQRGSTAPSTTVSSTARKTPGRDGSESVIIKERGPDGTTLHVVHQVGSPLPGGGVLVKHQHSKYGPLKGAQHRFPRVDR